MNSNLEHVNCNFCRKSITKPYATVSYADYLNRRPELKNDDDPMLKNKELLNYGFNLVKCKNCGLVYINPRLTEEGLKRLYKKEYFSTYANTKSLGHKKRQGIFEVEIVELEKLIQKLKIGRKILDVGCGGGFFLTSLNDSWKKHGIDINSFAVKYGRDTFGIDILKGNLREISFSDETFNVVNMRSTIEHLPDPMSELYETHRILRKGGMISICTPNIGGVCGKIYKEKFRFVCPAHHIYYFSTKTLSRLLKKAGFKIQKVVYPYFSTPYFSLLDPLKILYDAISLRIFRDPYVVSPPFFGNLVNVYATKKG